MISHIVRHNRGLTSSRAFTTSTAIFSKGFSTPKEFIQEKKQEQVEEQIYQQKLSNGNFAYEPKYLSENRVNEVTGRPIPINVEILKYKPINLPKTHGHQVAEIQFRGYDEDSLVRAGEFSSRAAFYLGIPTSKLVTEKTEKRLYTVIKSPFAQAKTKQNFHRVTYNRKLTAYDANPESIDLWLSFVNKHAIKDVDYKASITTYESLEFNKELDELSAADFKLPEAYSESEDPIAAKVKELLESETFKTFLEEQK